MKNAESLRRDGREAVARARAAVTELKSLPAETPGDRVLLAFDRIPTPLNGIGGRTHLYSQVHPDAELRDAAREIEQEMHAFGVELSLDREIYDRLVALDPARASGPLEGRLLERSLRDYRRAGVDRDEATRQRVSALQEELVRIGQEFDKNIVEDVQTFRIADGHAGLAGMPEDFLRSHPEDAQGAVEVSTDPQDRIPFMTYAERGDLRRAYHTLSLNRAWPRNDEVLGQLIAKRAELARLLGFENWAEYVTDDKMIGTAERAREFIERVLALAEARGRTEFEELAEERARLEGNNGGVNEWDRAFLEERVKQRKYDFDSQTVRPYFSYAKVRDGLLSTSAALFGVEFRRNESAELWHADVEAYEILDGGEPLARFYLDMHPRDGKFKHAAMFDLVEGVAGEALPEAALVCNFPRPGEGEPALLEHDQVTTFFHEFGHLLHHLFGGGQPFLHFSGISTEWDFVEAPSQMYEEWAWDTDVLQSFATHYETGEPIPAELVARMRAADEYGKGLQVRGQMLYAMLSLSYYTADPEGLDLTAHMVELKRRLSLFPHVEGTHMQASFGHLHGYSAIYYTYMWSLVIAKDLFSRFEGDLMNRAVADEYRRAILGAGGSKDAADLVCDFLGRPYDFAAFEAWINR